MNVTTIYMAEQSDGSYQPTTERALKAMQDHYVFEGVDGDEEANTVTYWFRRTTPDDECYVEPILPTLVVFDEMDAVSHHVLAQTYTIVRGKPLPVRKTRWQKIKSTIARVLSAYGRHAHINGPFF